MTEDEITARIQFLAKSEDTEIDHYRYDETVTEVLRYIAGKGNNSADIAQLMMRHPSPTEWGWYA